MPLFSVKIILVDTIESEHNVPSELVAAFWAGAEAQASGALDEHDEECVTRVEVTLAPVLPLSPQPGRIFRS